MFLAEFKKKIKKAQRSTMDTLKVICGICVHVFHRLFKQSTVCLIFPDIGTTVDLPWPRENL